jgi:hypothetical protein
MNQTIAVATQAMTKKPSTTVAEVRRVFSNLGVTPPSDYIEFMASSNGAEGAIGSDNYLVLWPAEQIVELNSAYEVNEFAPGLVLFGSDGADTAYAFDTRSDSVIVMVPFVGMDLDEVQHVAKTFREFVEGLASR